MPPHKVLMMILFCNLNSFHIHWYINCTKIFQYMCCNFTEHHLLLRSNHQQSYNNQVSEILALWSLIFSCLVRFRFCFWSTLLFCLLLLGCSHLNNISFQGQHWKNLAPKSWIELGRIMRHGILTCLNISEGSECPHRKVRWKARCHSLLLAASHRFPQFLSNSPFFCVFVISASWFKQIRITGTRETVHP